MTINNAIRDIMKMRMNVLAATLCCLAGTSLTMNATDLQGQRLFDSTQQRFFDSAQLYAETAEDGDELTEEEERAQAIEALVEAISIAEQQQGTFGPVPQASKTALQTAITTAKALKSTLDRGGIVAKLVSTKSIKDAAQNLLDMVQQMPAISEYYQGALAEIEVNQQISSTTAFNAVITAARGGIELSSNVSGMKNVLSTMHLGVLAYLQGVDSLAENQNLTGVIPNHSFDRGNTDEWYGMNVDLQSIDLSNFRLDNLASLASAIKLEMRDGTMAIRNADKDSIDAVHGRYYLYSNNSGLAAGQPIAQPLLGLPGGSYQLTARMSVTPGLLRTNNCHLAVLTVPNEVLKELIDGFDFSSLDISQIASSINISEILPVLLENGKVITAKARGTNINSLVDVSLSFDIQKNDFVMLVLNAGIAPFVGTSAYRADNLQLTYLHAPENIEDGIADMQAQGAATATYDLNGRIVSGRKKGILIKGGKKFMY